MKRLLFPSTFALVAVMLASGCSRGNRNAGSVGVPVLVARAVETNLPVQIDPPPVGHVMPISTVTVHSQIQGMISEVHFQEGQTVKKGDLLFTIDPRPSQHWRAIRPNWKTPEFSLTANRSCSNKSLFHRTITIPARRAWIRWPARCKPTKPLSPMRF